MPAIPDELDLLIAEVRATESAEAEAREARRNLRKAQSSEDAIALRTVIAQFEDKHVWQSMAQVLLIQRQHCSCGAIHQFSQGLFLRQSHRRDTHLSRLVPNDWPNCSLPKRIEYHDSSTNICGNCAAEWELPK